MIHTRNEMQPRGVEMPAGRAVHPGNNLGQKLLINCRFHVGTGYLFSSLAYALDIPANLRQPLLTYRTFIDNYSPMQTVANVAKRLDDTAIGAISATENADSLLLLLKINKFLFGSLQRKVPRPTPLRTPA
ncbi:MAG TPA: hypothetical protein VGZ47_12950 [Gemmataceae bacterium]|nr:hypothetical protein [Gemmataceae bacterium]